MWLDRQCGASRMTDKRPPAQSHRVRMQYNRWIVRLYADMTVGDCVGTIGPFDQFDQAEQAGTDTGLPDGDKAR